MPTVEEYLQSAWKIHQSGNVQQAMQAYQQVLAQVPKNANAWCYLGIALHDQRRYQEAVTAYEKAIAIQPNFPIAWNNMGNSLRYALRPEDAEKAFQKALVQNPNYVNAYKNRGTFHAWSGNLELALQSYSKAMKLSPDEPETHRNIGVISLLKGDFENGWNEYRWRWQCPEAARYAYSQPKWQGEDLQGKTILLYAEQGLGDTLQFIRFTKVLHDRGAKTIVHAQPALMAIFALADNKAALGIDRYVPNSLPIEHPFDYHCSLLDVADVLHTTTDTIPMSHAYLKASPSLMQYWSGWLNGLPKSKRKVGLVWQGNKDHQADIFRSFPLSLYEPLSELDDIQFISLQQGYGADQSKLWKGSQPLVTLPDGTDQSGGAFMDTAAILSQMDLLITSDTSIAHLAGALGRPAWVLLNKMPDWRWLLDRSDSPWYDSIRLFRQSTQSDWAEVLKQVKSALVS
jgi:tetratricopeptide (TPR) repeat protein